MNVNEGLITGDFSQGPKSKFDFSKLVGILSPKSKFKKHGLSTILSQY